MQFILQYFVYIFAAYNPRSSDYVRKKYKRKLQQFEDHCSLIPYLGNNMTKRFREPTERPIDFDHKMITFLNLEGIEPSPTWVAWCITAGVLRSQQITAGLSLGAIDETLYKNPDIVLCKYCKLEKMNVNYAKEGSVLNIITTYKYTPWNFHIPSIIVSHTIFCIGQS